MDRVIAPLVPGQGTQSPAMLTTWLALADTAERIATWSNTTGLDLHRLGTTADAEEIQDTAVTQRLVVALSLLAAKELARRVDLATDAPVAGRSVGELTAATVAGVLTADESVALAAVRGQEMAAAYGSEPTGMLAVLRGDPDDVAAGAGPAGVEHGPRGRRRGAGCDHTTPSYIPNAAGQQTAVRTVRE